jgi:hypothetical protein
MHLDFGFNHKDARTHSAIDFDFKIEFAHYANSDFDRIQLVSVISGGQAEGAANRAAKT